MPLLHFVRGASNCTQVIRHYVLWVVEGGECVESRRGEGGEGGGKRQMYLDHPALQHIQRICARVHKVHLGQHTNGAVALEVKVCMRRWCACGGGVHVVVVCMWCACGGGVHVVVVCM